MSGISDMAMQAALQAYSHLAADNKPHAACLRAAIEAAHPLFVRALDTIAAQREMIDALIAENNALLKELGEGPR
jgi:hypothetical protein